MTAPSKLWAAIAEISLLPALRQLARVCAVGSLCVASLAQATTVTFNTPGYTPWTVPAGVTSLKIVATGGGGGKGAGPNDFVYSFGGVGCIVSVNGYAVNPGDVLSLFVGGAGADGQTGQTSFGGGGGGGSTNVNAGLSNQIIAGGGGGGGGYGAYGLSGPSAANFGGEGGVCSGQIGELVTWSPVAPGYIADGTAGGNGAGGQGGTGGANGVGGSGGAGGASGGLGSAGGAGINGAGSSTTPGYGGGGGDGGYGGGPPDPNNINGGAGGSGGTGTFGGGGFGVGTGTGGGGFGGSGGDGGGGGGGGGGYGGGGGGGNGSATPAGVFYGGGGGGSGGSIGPTGATYSLSCLFKCPGQNGSIVITFVGPPVVTTDAGSAAFVAGDNIASTPVVVDVGVVIAADTATLPSATIAITGNFQSGEDVLAFTNDGSTMGNIAGVYDAATGVLSLTSSGGTATVAQWQAALQTVTYTDTAITPNNATRTVSFSVIDGNSMSSNTATRTVTVTDTDQTPIVTTSSGMTNYVVGASAQVVDSGVTVSDLDNTTQASGTVAVAVNFQSGVDTLAFTNDGSTMGNIVASYDNATGVLTLTSAGATATNAQWASALSAVTFSATSTPGTRTIAFVVNDGTNSSAAAIHAVAVIAAATTTNINAITPPGPITLGSSVSVSASVSVVAPGGGTPTGTIAVSDGGVGAGDSCTITLPGGTTCTLTPSGIGSHPITAAYSGDVSFLPSASGATSLSVTPASRTITATAGPNGSITPASQYVADGNQASFSLTPNNGYSAMIGGTCPAGTLSNNVYTTGAITADCTVTATFASAATSLTLLVTDNDLFARYGSLVNYIVTASNATGTDVTGLRISGGTSPDLDTSAGSWICFGSATQCAPTGTGPLIDNAVTIPAKGSVSWLVTESVLQTAPDAAVSYTVTLNGPSFASPVSQTDTDTLVVFRDGFDVPYANGTQSVTPLITASTMNWNGSSALTFSLPSTTKEMIESVLSASSVDTSGFRIERLNAARQTWLRAIAIDARGNEHPSEWTTIAPHASLTVGTAGTSVEPMLILIGTEHEIDMPLPGANSWRVAAPLDPTAVRLSH